VSQRRNSVIAIGLMLLLFFPYFRPVKGSSSAPVLRSSAKGPRRTPSEVPQTSLSRLQKRDPNIRPADRFREACVLEGSQTGSLAFVSPTVRARILEWRARPRYLQSCGHLESHTTPEPPAA